MANALLSILIGVQDSGAVLYALDAPSELVVPLAIDVFLDDVFVEAVQLGTD